MFGEFKAFLARGNVLDLAVGVIIGAAFGKIVSSLTDDVIMPLISFVIGDVDFSNKYAVLAGQVPAGATLAAAKAAGATVLAWGSFITAVINFLIIAWVVFLLVKAVNRLKAATARQEAAPAAAPAGPTELEVLLQIRDALKR